MSFIEDWPADAPLLPPQKEGHLKALEMVVGLQARSSCCTVWAEVAPEHP